MLTTRSRLILAPLAVAAVAVAATGCRDTSSQAGGTCTAGRTTLVGKLDGDSHPDKVSDPGGTGTKVTVRWGRKDGSFGPEIPAARLLGVKKGEVAAVAVADFENDGTLDMFAEVVKPSGVDDPASARLAEYRPGPLTRDGLRSAHPRRLAIGEEKEIEKVRVARVDDDAYPDLAILENAGDGADDSRTLRSKPGEGPTDAGSYTATHQPAKPLPAGGWTKFYKPCT